jgi:hypothetical protein
MNHFGGKSGPQGAQHGQHVNDFLRDRTGDWSQMSRGGGNSLARSHGGLSSRGCLGGLDFLSGGFL